MGKKSLVAGIILICFWLILWPGRQARELSFSLDVTSGPFFVIFIIISLILPLVVGIILIVKYFRSRKKEEQFSISQNNQDNSKKYEPQTNDETQFWVCPVCGKDTRELDGKSYCDNCQRYL